MAGDYRAVNSNSKRLSWTSRKLKTTGANYDPPRPTGLIGIFRSSLQLHHDDMRAYDIDAFVSHRCTSF